MANNNTEQTNAEREEEEQETRDLFLYNTYTSSEAESCNVLYLFFFFISLFFIMLMTADNNVKKSDYNSSTDSSNKIPGDEDFINKPNDEKLFSYEYPDSVIIQSVNFKGKYIFSNSHINNIYGNYMNIKKDDINVVNNGNIGIMNNKPIEMLGEKGGNFEAKIITLKLSVYNLTKLFAFFHFEPTDTNKSRSIHNNKKKKNPFEFVGISGINVNKNSNFIFNGIGYNILTLCQNKNSNNNNNNNSSNNNNNNNNSNNNNNNKEEDICLCNYNIYMNQNVSSLESTSLKELEEPYLYFLKKYLINEVDHYNKYISTEYYKKYDDYISNIESYYNDIYVNNIQNYNVDGDGDALDSSSKSTQTQHGTENGDNDGAKIGDNDGAKIGDNDELIQSYQDGIIEPTDINNIPKSTHDYDGYILSNNCNLFIQLKGDDINQKEIFNKINIFTIVFNIKSIIELCLFGSQIGKSDNIRNIAKVSIMCICLNSLIEVFESLLLLYEVMLSKLLLIHFIVMILLKFILFTFMEIRFILIIWKATHQQNVNDRWEQMQRQLSKLYKYYYSSIIIVIILFYYVFPIFPYFLLLIYFCWLPQILLDIWKGQRKSIDLKFVFLLSLCRMFLPLYIFIYPYNVFSFDVFSYSMELSHRLFSILLVIILTVQIALMCLQRMYGPRYFINIDLLPHVHNYYKTVDINFEAGIPECVICMYDIVLKDRKYCVTPCFHIFHEKCLQQWMDIKLECPTCRGALPNFP
ncbi:Ring finger domain/zinc-RING finger domain containing protein, putative [Hepatocystis sp. ex Piliocolobus tephrosceles]|nr:Ring finger domain/zinc-RING finger domain containing protein, putative [Hepatocystis sp. ex Piliocolobus tephrosceles]